MHLHALLFLPLSTALAGPARPRNIHGPRSFIDDLGDDIKSLTSDIKNEVLSLKDSVKNSVIQLPGVKQIKEKLDLTDEQIAKLPLEVLNMPGYAKYADGSWKVRMRGQAVKQPFGLATDTNGKADVSEEMVSTDKLDAAVNAFIPDIDISQLPDDEKTSARNLTSALLSLPQDDLRLNFTLQKAGDAAASGQTWTQNITWPSKTDDHGEFNEWIPLQGGDFPAGDSTSKIVRLDAHTDKIESGNSTEYLVPNEGVTVVSDIDDILRITKIFNSSEMLLNTFVRNYTPWMNMPEIYSKWSTENPDYHFHYLTTTPEPGTRAYMDFIYKNYPLGSFDTRPYNFSTIEQTFKIRRYWLEKILQAFPKRKFVLVADLSNQDVMADYPTMAKNYPDQVQCLLIRNTTSTIPDYPWPYDTSEFKDVPDEKLFFFNTPDDVKGLKFASGDCVNSTVKRWPLEYGYQHMPKGVTAKILNTLAYKII